MDQNNLPDRMHSDSPIPTTLKRKRGPSRSDGLSGDLAGGKPVAKQGKEEDQVDGLVVSSDDVLESNGSSGDDSDSSGNNSI